jgi:RNA polymerase sigma-70 factor (ECF subfamily)
MVYAMESLAEAFAAAWRGRVNDVEGLDAALRRAVEGARRTFPRVVLHDAQAVRYIAARLPTDCDPSEVATVLRVPEVLLAAACADGDERAIEAFDDLFLRPAAEALVRSGQERSETDEALQILRERLFVVGVKIRDFSGRGSLAAWTRVSLARQLTSLQRSAGRGVPLGDAAEKLPVIDPELAVMRRRYGETFRAAFEDAFRRLAPDQRSVLRLHFVDGLSLDRIAPILQVSRATVGRRVLEAKTALLHIILALLGERLQATPSEIESLLAVVRSGLYPSLSGLLRTS